MKLQLLPLLLPKCINIMEIYSGDKQTLQVRVNEKQVLEILQNVLHKWDFLFRKELIGPNAIGKLLVAGIRILFNNV